MPDDAFYLPLGDDRFASTVRTTGPWDVRFQHGGPPSALLGRAIERCQPRAELVVARVTVEILGPIPVEELRVSARVLRPGRSVELVESSLTAGGREVARAAAWRVRRTEVDVPSRLPPPPPPDDAEPLQTPPGWADGYLTAVQWRPVAGSFAEPGPATAWTRLRYPLVAGEQVSPLSRVLAVADSGNGLSGELDLTRFHYINPELTVHLHREPVGEWVCLDARTVISAGGAGLATTTISDVHGACAAGAQSLLVAPRS